MIIDIDRSGTVEGFNKLFYSFIGNNEVKSVLIMACDENDFTKDSIDHTLKKSSKEVFGGIFPEIIYYKEKLSKGTIFAGLTKEANIVEITNLSDLESDFESELEKKAEKISESKTLFVFVDGLAKRISSLIEALFNTYGLGYNYIGGGGGSLSFIQKPCIFSNNGLLMDSAVIVGMDINSGIGVNHGWETISRAYKVTESDKNVIKTLDWEPAFQVYRKDVEKHSKKKFTDTNFFDIAKGYPFGLSKIGTEKIVRDPISLGEDDSLICVGEVPEGGYINILFGEEESLVRAAHDALLSSKDAFGPSTGSKTTLFIDCISRVLFLGDNFGKELEVVHEDNVPMIGALTIGEIANSGSDYLEFYNKTSVIALLED